MQSETSAKSEISFEDFKAQVIEDYKLAVTSRECSLLGRREVLTGKAKFGIFGDGKEVPQLAWAKGIQKWGFSVRLLPGSNLYDGHWRLNIQQFFAGLYATTDIEQEPTSAGRQMGGHFATHSFRKTVHGRT